MFDDFIKKAFIMLTILYVIFFGAETVLPGIIVDIFNLNLLLVFWLASLIYLLFSSQPRAEIKPISRRKKKKWEVLFLVSMSIFLAWVFFVALYKVSVGERLIYLLLALVFLKYIFAKLK